MVHRRSVDALFEVPPHLHEVVKQSLGEDAERLRHLEHLLEQWFKCQKHLPQNYDKKMARGFLRGAKYNLEIAKKKLEGYFLAKHAFPDFYFGRDPSSDEISKVFECVNIVRMPQLTEKGERICVMSLNRPDPNEFDMVASIKLFWMLYDLTLTSEHPVYSEIYIFDCAHFSSDHMIKFLGSNLKHSITILRDSYASRISQVHVINCPLMVEKLISIVKPLFTEKVRKRFTVHKGTDSLMKHLPPKLLPVDIGGSLDCLRDYSKIWQGFVLENSDWFREQENVKMVGAPPKRIEKFTYDMSLEGSFRQLNID